jgi:hypothetical protein
MNLVETAKQSLNQSDTEIFSEGFFSDIIITSQISSKIKKNSENLGKLLKSGNLNMDETKAAVRETIIDGVNIVISSKLSSDMKVTFLNGYLKTIYEGLIKLPGVTDQMIKDKLDLPEKIYLTMISKNDAFASMLLSGKYSI